jgi:hypothetical protein
MNLLPFKHEIAWDEALDELITDGSFRDKLISMSWEAMYELARAAGQIEQWKAINPADCDIDITCYGDAFRVTVREAADETLLPFSWKMPIVVAVDSRLEPECPWLNAALQDMAWEALEKHARKMGRKMGRVDDWEQLNNLAGAYDDTIILTSLSWDETDFIVTIEIEREEN